MTQPPHKPAAHQGDVCPWWLCPLFDNPLRRRVQNPGRIVTGLVQPGETALDLGCGMGYLSIPLARLAGPSGKVICVDLQEQMLAGVRRRAEQAGVLDRIELVRATPGNIGVAQPVDAALAFWMLHEVPDQGAFLSQVNECLKPGGRFLIVEPRLHVSESAFERCVELAGGLGLSPVARPEVRMSRAVLLAKK